MRRILLLLFVVVLGGALAIGYLIFGPKVKNPHDRFLYIPTGAGMQQLKDSLRANAFLSGFSVFHRVASYTDLPRNIKPGKYKIQSGMSLYSLTKKLRSGRQEPVNLVITRIRLKEDLAKRIGRGFELDSARAMAFLTSNDSLLPFDVDTNTVLTTIFPDTYTYFWTATMSTIFDKLFKERQKFWTPERMQQAAHHGLTPDEVYVMASIVEEETNKKEDKGKIASVYINRIKKGMTLSADPTIKYAMKDFTLTRIYHRYLDVVSPYNTYRNRGLPPGPICTPSRETIEEVLNAPETNYLFFVAKPDFSGYSNFAVTYNEHLIYARAYQQALNELEKRKAQKKQEEKQQAD